jgi:hypothetical protein
MQWILGNFTHWKIYCSAPGRTSTNNALESFNNVMKRCYIFVVLFVVIMIIINNHA